MTYDQWVRYFLNNGALLNLARNMAAAKIRESEEKEWKNQS